MSVLLFLFLHHGTQLDRPGVRVCLQSNLFGGASLHEILPVSVERGTG